MKEEAIFAAGCFWGVEAAFRRVTGVLDTTVGYCGGHTADPSYEEVCAGESGHAECVRVVFDTAIVSYEELLDVFWKVHDPCSRNRQGPDVGTQYRSAIFCHGEAQMKKAIASRDRLNRRRLCGEREVATEIRQAPEFHLAEEYHQRYHEKHRFLGALCAR